jgi:hypothetical protein
MLASLAVSPPHALGAGDCEAWRDGPLGQPTNALTSLGLVAAGGWVAARGRAVPPGRRWRPAGYGVLLAAAGLGSVAYHGRGGAGSRRLHDLSLYTLVATTAAAELGVAVSRSPRSARARGRPRRRHGSVVVVGSAAAPLAYLLGRTSSPVCRPTSRWQWHGVWHLLVAATLTAWAEGTLIRPDLASDGDGGLAAERTLP